MVGRGHIQEWQQAGCKHGPTGLYIFLLLGGQPSVRHAHEFEESPESGQVRKTDWKSRNVAREPFVPLKHARELDLRVPLVLSP